MAGEKKFRPRKKIGVIIYANTNDARHAENVLFAESVLAQNGFSQIHIFYRASKARVKSFFGNLESGASRDDLLFVYITGHGYFVIEKEKTFDSKVNSYGQVSVIDLGSESISDYELAGWLKNVKAKKICLFDQCFGGNFAEMVADGINTVAISPDYGETIGNSFPKAFFSALLPPVGYKDKNISLAEAFDVALERDANTQRGRHHPIIFSRTLAEEIMI